MSYTKICLVCAKGFQSRQPNAKTCSLECRKKNYSTITGRIVHKNIGIPHNTIGAMSELYVAGELMKKGYSVFRSLSSSCFCDLIAIKDKNILYVEARTGYRNITSNNISFPQITRGDINCFGVYERNEGKVYFFDRKINLIKEI